MGSLESNLADDQRLSPLTTARIRRIRCKMCGESREIEVETWDDRVEQKFDHPCKEKGPRLSHPVTREGDAIPFFPVGDKVIVQRIPEQVMAGTLHIPDTAQPLQQYATLVAASPQAQGILDDAGISIGDTICFPKYSGVSWDWIPTGKMIADRRSVEMVNAKDIFGCKELAEKMFDGRLGIGLACVAHGSGCCPIPDCAKEYRFFAEQKDSK